MRDFGKCTWKRFNDDVSTRELYVFGAGARGGRIAELVNDGVYEWKIKAFIDNYAHGSKLWGYDILSPEVLKGKDPESYVILVSLLYPGVISSQLDDLGVVYCYSYFYLTEGGRSFIQQDLVQSEEVKTIRKMLQDEKSKWTFDRILEKRKNGTIDYSDISESGDEYFRSEFFTRTDNEVFLDGGAFDGDTIDGFHEWTKGKYREIYSFEADPNMISVIKHKLYRWHDVHLIDKGLWDKKATLSFAIDNKIMSSHISSINSENTINIDCVSFEEEFGPEVPLSFIKLDIEGAEIQAINGMKNIIQKFRPKLAISIYHKPEDLWEIPMLIHKLVPEYRLNMRHFGHNYFGTNLYATV
ncbi:MAG: FkbM family methyltransferase [Butyrivibrio sp.]|nr:FkbM family methyltransferase [Butyrivibrio sp.]